jgi:NADPH-dependent glutamate synthase beta subunit-like oxidoreductase
MKVSIRRPEDVPAGTPMAVSLRSTADLSTGNWRTFRPLYVTRPSPCNLDCPAGTDVRRFLTQAAAGDIEGAWRTIVQHNPLPGICGRVCYHPCEAGCNRAGIDERVAIHAVERAIASEATRRNLLQQVVDSRAPLSGAHIAVVGSGPAGLSCAYHLALRGHTVTIFEAEVEPGGMLRYGIPEYRLPRHVLNDELDLLRALSIDFRTSMRLNANLLWEDLLEFDGIFVGVGIQRSKSAGVTGENLGGVLPALHFLRDVNAGGDIRVSGRVVIIGGGNTALDAARVAVRQDAQVTVVYRRSRAEMPAHPDEIAQAEREGVKFVFQAVPVRFMDRKGSVHAVRFQRTRLGAPDASGRRRPEPIPGDLFNLAANYVLTAIGEELDDESIASALAIARGRVTADRWGRTAIPTVFAGGDAATGAGTVVEAIGSGRRAAEALHAHLSGGDIAEAAPDAQRVGPSDLNAFYFANRARVHVPTLHRTYAVTSFKEVAGGLFWKEATVEAARCLSCGLCDACGNCQVFCPDAAVSRVEGGFAIDYAHCKGCGICVAECPRGAMALVAEEAR